MSARAAGGRGFNRDLIVVSLATVWDVSVTEQISWNQEEFLAAGTLLVLHGYARAPIRGYPGPEISEICCGGVAVRVSVPPKLVLRVK
eukprot:69275-Rhodomonas_salina.1